MQNAWQNADTWLVGHYVILPDHVHLFAAPNGDDVPSVKNWVRFWKTVVTNQWPCDRVGSLSLRDYWDRQLRTGDSYAQKWEYVKNNPVRHGLVGKAEDWRFQGEQHSLLWHD